MRQVGAMLLNKYDVAAQVGLQYCTTLGRVDLSHVYDDISYAYIGVRRR